MSKFLTEDDKSRIKNHRGDFYYGDPIAADRIEQLAATCEQLEERNKELALHLLAVHGQAADALDKLAKAAETLRGLITCVDDGCYCSELKMATVLDDARAMLIELEKKE